MTKEKFTNIEHTVVNFVDDSNSFVSLEGPIEANVHADRYFKDLEYFYKNNELVKHIKHIKDKHSGYC